jgi:hypothetical protein
MISPMQLVAELRSHQDLYHEILAAVEKEGRALREADAGQPLVGSETRKNLMPRLNESLDILKKHRIRWTQASPAERAQHPEVAALLRQSQDLIMKIIVQDRENEQALLRRGMIPPRHLPPANSTRPNYVANVYQRQRGPAGS